MWNLEAKPLLVTLLNGRYQVLKVLSATQGAQTYFAEDTHTSEHSSCIIQQFPFVGSVSNSCSSVEGKFGQMIQKLEALTSHAQIPQLLAYFEDHHSFYIVQEWIEGRSLRKELATGTPWTETQVIEFLQEITGILEFVHRHGMVHGNLNAEHLICRHQDHKYVMTAFDLETQLWQPILKAGSPDESSCLKLNAASLQLPVNTHSNQAGTLVCPHPDLYQLGIIALQALTGMPVQFSDSPYCWDLWEETLPISSQLLCILQQMLCPQIRNQKQDDPHPHTLEVLQALKSLPQFCESPSVLTPVVPSVTLQAMPEFESTHNTPPSEPQFQPHPTESEDGSVLPGEPANEPSSEPITPMPEQTDHDSKNNQAQTDSSERRKVKHLSPALLLTLTGLAVGLTANVAAIIFAVYNLLFAPTIDPGLELFVQARSEYQAGNIQTALKLANSVASYSAAYHDAKSSITQWQSNWKIASEQFQLIEEAFQQKRWHDVLEASQKVPEISAWHQKIEPMIAKATSQLDTEIQPLLKMASDRAIQKDFAGAVAALKQIPQGIPDYEQVAIKINEYTKKQKIKNEYIAHQLLSKAYAKAASKDFASALKYLKQVPKETEAFTTVYIKQIEYTKKLREQTKGKPKSKAAINKSRVQASQPAHSFQTVASRVQAQPGTPVVGNEEFLISPSTMSSRLNPGNFLHEVQTVSISFAG